MGRAIFIEGPSDCSARLTGDQGMIIAGDAVENTVVLRRLELHVSAGPALLIAGGCTVDRCSIEGADVGIEVTARTGSAVRILQSVVRGCRTGISLSGGAATALAGTRVERCGDAVAVPGLNVNEGWNEVFRTLEDVVFEENSGANLALRGWSIREKSGIDRLAPPGEELAVRDWPGEACNVVAPTDRGPVVLHVTGGQVNATLFEDDEEEGADAEGDGSFEASTLEKSPKGEALALQTSSEP